MYAGVTHSITALLSLETPGCWFAGMSLRPSTGIATCGAPCASQALASRYAAFRSSFCAWDHAAQAILSVSAGGAYVPKDGSFAGWNCHLIAAATFGLSTSHAARSGTSVGVDVGVEVGVGVGVEVDVGVGVGVGGGGGIVGVGVGVGGIDATKKPFASRTR